MGDTDNSSDIHDDNAIINPTDEENFLNSTQDIISKGLVLKSEYLQDDIIRMVQYVQTNKRSDKIKELDVESFRFDVYSRNQSGFCTALPICWALALEKYISKTVGVSSRWVHKDEKTNLKFGSSEILLYFNTTNCVNIIINYTQGFVMVKGTLFRKWIDEEFPKVQKEFVAAMFPDGSILTDMPASSHNPTINDPPRNDGSPSIISDTVATDSPASVTSNDEMSSEANLDYTTKNTTSKRDSKDDLFSQESCHHKNHPSIPSACNDVTTNPHTDTTPSVIPSDEMSRDSNVENSNITTNSTPKSVPRADLQPPESCHHNDVTINADTDSTASVISTDEMSGNLNNTTIAPKDVPKADLPLDESGLDAVSSILKEHDLSAPVHTGATSDNVISAKDDRSDVRPKTPSKSCTKLLNETELDILWKKLEETDTAITTQDSVIQKIISRCQNIELKVNELKPETLLFNAEKKFDEKLTSFFKLWNEEIDKRIEGINKTITNKIQDTLSKIDKLRSLVHTIKDNGTTIPIALTTESNEEIIRLNSELKKLDSDVAVSIKSSEEGFKFAIAGLEDNLKLANVNIDKHSNSLLGIEKNLKSIHAKFSGGARPRNENSQTNSPIVQPSVTNYKEHITELLICFDSNRKHIEWDKLWKAKGTKNKNCGNLHDVSKVFESLKPGEKIQHLLLHVGVNDLDCKDHTQVFGEMQLLLDQIRQKHEGIKIVVSEATPRNDSRDGEVKAFNELLQKYAKSHSDITIAYHSNLRDPSWSMFADAKHIRGEKVAKFAANLIFALKKAYGISSKRELFETGIHKDIAKPTNSNVLPLFGPRNDGNSKNMPYGGHPKPLMNIAPTIPHQMADRLKHLADYEDHQPHEFELFKKNLQRNLQNAISKAFEWG